MTRTRCRYCRTRPLLLNSRGTTGKTCGRDRCRRAHDAARQRDHRDRVRNAPPEPEPAPPTTEPEGQVVTPFGTFVDGRDEETGRPVSGKRAAWLHVLRSGEGDSRQRTYQDAIDWLDENAADDYPARPDGYTDIGEIIGLAPEDDPLSPDFEEDIE